MVRERKQQQRGNFFIVKRLKVFQEYYVESGVSDVGSPEEAGYIYWTRYKDSAHGFKKLAAARKIADMLWADHGVKVKIVNAYGVTVE